MRSCLIAVLLAGVAGAGLAQSPLPAGSSSDVPPAPSLPENARALGRLDSFHIDRYKPSAPLLVIRHELQSAEIKGTEDWNDSIASGAASASPRDGDGPINGVPSRGATELSVGLPNLLHADSADRSSNSSKSNSLEPFETGFDASSYVPLDSWVYSSFDRLAAAGYVPTSSATVRPWTRLECARLLAEAHENADLEDGLSAPLLAALDLEFAHETRVMAGASNIQAQVESVYSRSTSIAGTPLRDSFHFGQTLADDFGRPYGQGENEVTGASIRAEAGALAFYLRGEYQYAAALPAYNQAAQQAIVIADNINLNPAGAQMPYGWNLRDGVTSRIRAIEAYAAVNLSNWQISFGQEGLWWGPDRTTSLILSNNAEAMPMLRFARVRPIKMPEVMNAAGPLYVDFFISREGGVHYVGLGPSFNLYGNAAQPLNPSPYLWGATLSIKPTPNLEFGFGHTVIFAGYGRPLNFRTFFHTFSIIGNVQTVDPGKRATEFNLTYHLPGLRKSVVIYTEAFAWDNPVEGKFLARYAMDPGIYIPRLPGIKRMDLRMEGAYTNLPGLTHPAYFYSNAHYPQGYTNYGQIIGSWVGKQGSGGQASTSYWFTGRTKATVSYRRMTADKAFLQGGNLSDASGTMTWLIKPGIEFAATGQYERWNFPLLATGAQSDFTASFEIRVHPKAKVGSR